MVRVTIRLSACVGVYLGLRTDKKKILCVWCVCVYMQMIQSPINRLPFDGFIPFPKRTAVQLGRDLFPRSSDFWRWRWDFSQVLDEFSALIAFQAHLKQMWEVRNEWHDLLDHRLEHEEAVGCVYMPWLQDERGPLPVPTSYTSTKCPECDSPGPRNPRVHWRRCYNMMIEMRRARRKVRQRPPGKMMSDERIQWLTTCPYLGDYLLSFISPHWFICDSYLVEPRSYGVSHCLPDWFALETHHLQTRCRIDYICHAAWGTHLRFNTALCVAMSIAESYPGDGMYTYAELRAETALRGIDTTTAVCQKALYLVDKHGVSDVNVFHAHRQSSRSELAWTKESLGFFRRTALQIKGWQTMERWRGTALPEQIAVCYAPAYLPVLKRVE
jgi:hypothetical protein